jgi:P pilus assembly chaperone PapD
MKRLLLFVVILCVSLQSFASLLISPTYAYFEGRDRSAQVILVNSSNEAQTYRLELSDKEQLPNGNYENIENGQFAYSARELLRVSPRQVSLGPGERQTIKIIKRNTSGLANGDYRSHLTFKLVPKPAVQSDSTPSGVNLNLTAIINYSIPIVVKVGDGSSNVDIESALVELMPETSNAAVKVSLNKTGAYGMFGRLEIWSFENNVAKNKIGTLNGSNMFRESNNITFYVDVDSKDLSPSDSYMVTYTDIMTRQQIAKKIIN